MKNLDIVYNNGILAGFTNRFGGVSCGAYSELNLGDHVGDLKQSVARNREILRSSLGVRELKFMQQIHSNKVEVLKKPDDVLPACDGVITDLCGIGLCVLAADCSPILIFDSSKNVIAVIHAGRAGVIGKICTNAVGLMRREFGCKSADLRLFVGANIKLRNYEVGELDLGDFNRYKNNGNFDINAALKDEFISLEIEDFSFDERCTFESNELFSYRRDRVTGRFAGFIAIR